MKFIEDALVYRLPWGMEAVRVRALAHKTDLGNGFTVDDLELGLAVQAIETGTLSVSAALLMKAGFSSRTAAIAVVTETDASFETMGQLRGWLKTGEVKTLSERDDWPTSESASLWAEFVASLQSEREKVWNRSHCSVTTRWFDAAPAPGQPVRLLVGDGDPIIAMPDYTEIGQCMESVSGLESNLISATVSETSESVVITSLGPINIRKV